MQKKNTILLLGIISIIILISVQVFIIMGILKQKNEMFVLRSTMRSQEAIYAINRRMQTDGFDTVRLILDPYSEQANKELHAIKDREKLAEKKSDILDFFTRVVNQEQDLSELLSSYFESRGYEKKFKYTIVINDIEIISNDTIVIYQREGFSNRRPFDRGTRTSPSEVSGSSILVKWTTLEGNNYRFSFNYYIDFSDKQKVIWAETFFSLAMSILSILVVVLIFMITYRNLREEKRLSNLKTDFINNMTHELKTPLSTLTVAGKTLELEQIRTNEAKIIETAKLISKQSVHLNQLINMILEISMWERTQFQLDKKTIDIEEFLNDVVNSFKSGLGNNAIINQKYNFSGAKVDLDVVYFTTLLNNLLTNAVKYSENSPLIEVEGFNTENTISVKITDNGIGINKSDQKHIFDKFYRASTGNIHKFKGLGLGLYYVKKIAEAHNGDVTVISKPGKGSTFTLTIPFNSKITEI
jgi:two-component system, OmpR family, phosphate regulon sensor histidine kinase PhoR